MNQYKDILAGLFGGSVSAILLLAANLGGVVSLVLFLLVTFPLYVVTLGWGTRAGIAATLAAFGILLATTFLASAISFTLLFFAIAAILGHQANLARTDPQAPDNRIWFPLSRLLFNMSWMIIVAIIIAGMLNQYSLEGLEQAYFDLLQQVLKPENGQPLMTTGEIRDMARVYAGMMPFVLPTVLIIVHVINLYLAAFVTRRSQLFFRPRDDIPATLTLPVISVIALAIGMAGIVLLGGAPGQVSRVVAGTFVTSLALVGLASLHNYVRNNSAAPLILFLVYAACLLFMLPFYLLSIPGIVRVTSTQHGNPNPNQPQS